MKSTFAPRVKTTPLEKPMNEPLKPLDIPELRKSARQHMEEGAVTAGYSADRTQVIAMLNDALATELVCVLRYRRHHFMASGIHSHATAAEFLVHSNEEQGHADQLAERIVQLGGEPDFSPDSLSQRSHAEYVEGVTLGDMIRALDQGHDVCYTRYLNRQHRWWRQAGSRFNDRVATWLLGKPPGVYLSSFKALRREIVREVVKYDGPYTYLDGLILDVTHSITTVDVVHRPRHDGESTYTFRRLVSLWVKMATSFFWMDRVRGIKTLCFSRSPRTRSSTCMPISWWAISRPRKRRVTFTLSPSPMNLCIARIFTS